MGKSHFALGFLFAALNVIPAAHAAEAGDKLDEIVVTATLPAILGGASAQAQLRVGVPWAAEPNPPRLAVVPGGGWPGTIVRDECQSVTREIKP